MSLVSLPFLALTALSALLYWLAPRKWRWVVLLAASWGFYLCCGLRAAAPAKSRRAEAQHGAEIAARHAQMTGAAQRQIGARRRREKGLLR